MVTKRCADCGERFDGRADAQFCSAACRQHAYRDRKQSPPTTTETISAKVAELARLSGELEDALHEFMWPNTRRPRPEAVLGLDVDDHVARLARRASDNMQHVSNALSLIRNESRKRNASRHADPDAATVVDLHAVDDA